MKLVVQRVLEASVTVDGEVAGSIEKGFLVLWGAAWGDTKEICEKMAAKCIKLRIFEDDEGRMNRSLKDIGGGLLVVSQFTLYADCRKGNRPNFLQAMPPSESEPLYEYFLQQCEKEGIIVKKGVFGADMKIHMVGDGPVTICLNSKELTKS